MSDSAVVIFFDGDDTVSAMVRTAAQGRRIPSILAKAVRVAGRLEGAAINAGTFAAHVAAVLDRHANSLADVSLLNTPTALATAITGDDFSDFEGEEPEEEFPTVDAGVYIVEVETGDVTVKSGYDDGNDFNALTVAVPLAT
jgi:hypothetical protein